MVAFLLTIIDLPLHLSLIIDKCLVDSPSLCLLVRKTSPTNNIRRKKLYRQLTLMLNGGPVGAGVRRELPACCVTGICQMLLPSNTFMGFKEESIVN